MPRLLLDEDIKARSLVRLLREAGHDVVTTADLGLDGYSDAEVLTRATREDRTVITYNCDDFRLLHEISTTHSGIIVVYQEPQKSISYAQIIQLLGNLTNSGNLARGILHLLNQWLY